MLDLAPAQVRNHPFTPGGELTGTPMQSASGKAPIRFDERATGPLDGVRVLDLSRLVAGNMLSLQLGDFGADVIKVEPPTGDPLRDWREGGHELHWKTYARNKRSIVLNLRHESAKDALLRMVARADVFIENYRPGTLEERSEEHTSELQSRLHLVCRLLLEKKKKVRD